ncbi:MAG: DUF881 domain-containing protein [Nocardioidaceae bacterium]|nr:DUF881 domain-containing protein [Nocardioidaceae bacterium]
MTDDIPPPTDRGSRLRDGLTGRPGRGQFVAAALLALLGFAGAVQIRFIHEDTDYGGRRREELIELLGSLSGAADRAESQIDELERARTELLSSSQRRQAAIDESRTQLTVLGILTGTLPAVGPGVTIEIADPSAAITSTTILNGVEELRDAGAEAIEVNDRVRIVASTSFTDDNDVLVVDGVEVRAPYIIDVIGSSHTLSEAVVFPGGLTDEVTRLGGTVQVTEADRVDVRSLHTIERPEYAQPTGG